MPRYEFECDDCGVQFDVTRPMAQAHEPAACSVCGQDARRIFDLSPIIFRPEGWNLSPDDPSYFDVLDKPKERLKCQQ